LTARARIAAAAALACAALLFTGCVRIVSLTASQSPLSSVAVSVEVCAVNSGSCPTGALPINAVTDIGQILLGFRVPAATVEPESFDSTDPAGVVSFAKNASFTAELERLSPAGAGRRWVGYLSNPVNYNSGGGAQSFRAVARFTLMQAPDGGPFVRPFRYRAVAGARRNDPESPARAVVCGQASLDHGSQDETTICANSPALADLGSDLQFASRDAGVLAEGAHATALPGALAAVPFTVKYSGAGGDEAPRLTLTASTTLPGAKATATPNVAIPPADGSVKALVTVEVPAGAAPGDYAVRLVATPPLLLKLPGAIIGTAILQDTNPRSRAGVGAITVQPPPAGGGGGGPVAGGASVTLSKTTAAVRFRRSTPRGAVVIRGKSSKASHLNILIQRRGKVASDGRLPPVTTSLFRTRKVAAGAFRARIRIPAGFVPGAYRVRVAPLTVDGVALPQRIATVRLPAPPEGVVDSAYVSAKKGAGPPVRRFETPPTTIFANFRFVPGALPRKGPKLGATIQWSRNGRPIVEPVPRRRRRALSSFVRLQGAVPLPPGHYRAVLKVGPTIVAVASTRIG
jgi:hypothetical protein